MGNVVLKPGRDGTCRAVTCRTVDILLLSGNIGKGVVTADTGSWRSLLQAAEYIIAEVVMEWKQDKPFAQIDDTNSTTIHCNIALVARPLDRHRPAPAARAHDNCCTGRKVR